MKIIQPRSTSKKVALTGILVVIALGISACVYVYAYNGNILGWSKNNHSSDSSINYNPPTEDQKKEGLSTKEAFVDKHYSSNDEKNPNTSENTDDTSSEETSIIISSASQTSDMIQLRTIIQSVNTGICTLSMSSPGVNTITRETETQNLGSYSTCKGFDIPLSELQAGTWDITINYKNDKEAGIANQKMEIKK